MTAVTAPPFCDLEWSHAGPAVFIGKRTPLYEEAIARARTGMLAAGFDLDRPHVHLDIAGCTDFDRLTKRLATWTRVAREHLEHELKQAAAQRPLTGAAIAPVQEGLIAMLAEASWALGNRADLAEGFAHAPALSRRQYEWALDILASARIAVKSADARLSTVAGAEALERAYREDVRDDLLAACIELTALDQDQCREANGQGWSAVASAPGHRLAGMDSLSVLQAAHAWSLVHPHRRQLSEDLKGRLFGIS